jgi:Ras-related protein Rab-1A
MEPIHTFNIVLIGDRAVGKTTFLTQYKSNTFPFTYKPHTTVMTHLIFVETPFGSVRFNVTDIPECTTDSSIFRKYYKKAHAVIMMFDMGNYLSYMNLDLYKKEVKKYNNSIPILIVGNKNDLAEDKRFFVKGVHTFAEDNGHPLVEICTADKINLHSVFQTLLHLCTNNYELAIIY